MNENEKKHFNELFLNEDREIFFKKVNDIFNKIESDEISDKEIIDFFRNSFKNNEPLLDEFIMIDESNHKLELFDDKFNCFKEMMVFEVKISTIENDGFNAIKQLAKSKTMDSLENNMSKFNDKLSDAKFSDCTNKVLKIKYYSLLIDLYLEALKSKLSQ